TFSAYMRPCRSSVICGSFPRAGTPPPPPVAPLPVEPPRPVASPPPPDEHAVAASAAAASAAAHAASRIEGNVTTMDSTLKPVAARRLHLSGPGDGSSAREAEFV